MEFRFVKFFLSKKYLSNYETFCKTGWPLSLITVKSLESRRLSILIESLERLIFVLFNLDLFHLCNLNYFRGLKLSIILVQGSSSLELINDTFEWTQFIVICKFNLPSLNSLFTFFFKKNYRSWHLLNWIFSFKIF